MKKTACIHLVLITAALASCNRPLYQQEPPRYYQQDTTGEIVDSTNSCPMGADETDLPPDYYTWFYGFRPYGLFYNDPFYIQRYYHYRYPATIIRAGFGRGGSGHS